MRIADVMTASLVTAAPETPVREVAALMRERGVGSVVLVEGERPVGIVTDRDLTTGVLAAGRSSDEAVGAVASAPVVTVPAAGDVEEVADLMVRNGIRRVPVDDEGRLVGIVTLDDLVARTGHTELPAALAQSVTRAALPEFYFLDRGG